MILRISVVHDPLPESFTFTTAEVWKQILEAYRSSSGGLSGTKYKFLRAWYSNADEIADALTVVLSRIAAGDVPTNLQLFRRALDRG